jgi:hypothetical protein
MLFVEIIGVCCGNHFNHINTTLEKIRNENLESSGMVMLHPWVLHIESQKTCIFSTAAMRTADHAKCRPFKC